MSSYAIPITTAFFIFAIIAFLGTIPWTIYQYRKHGYFSFWRNFVFFSFLYYCLTAFFLVSLPLPKNRNNIESKNHIFIQLKPLNMLQNFKEVPGFQPTNFRTYPTLFKSFTFLEVAFNVALLFPLGVYLRYFLKKVNKWFLALIITFSVTLFFEVSQLTALFGYYTYPYRLFDVDDLLMNTLGGMIGFFLAPLLLFLIPSRDQIKQKDTLYQHNQLASYGAQLLEILVSMMLARFIGSIFSTLLFHGDYLFTCNTISIFIFIVLFPIIAKGKTLGGKLVKIKFSDLSSKDIFKLSYRFIVIYFPSVLSQLTFIMNSKPSEGVSTIITQIVLFIVSFVTWFVFGIIIVRDWTKKKAEPFFNRIVSLSLKRY